MKKILVLLPILTLTACVMAPNSRVNNNTSSSEKPKSSENVLSSSSQAISSSENKIIEESSSRKVEVSSSENIIEQESSNPVIEEETSGLPIDERTNIGAIKIWVDRNIADVTDDQIEEYLNTNSDYTFTYDIQSISFSSTASEVIKDPEYAADLYFFAQDAMPKLISAKALAKVPSTYKDFVSGSHIQSAIEAATRPDGLYAYPASLSSVFFMYYNKSDLAGVDITDFNAIVAKVKSLGKEVFFNATSAWYNAAFFHGAGAHSTWTTNDKGKFTDYDDTYDTPAGQIAVKGMHELFSDPTCFSDNATGDAFSMGGSVLISGTWYKEPVLRDLGDNLGVALLPNYTVDGVQHPLIPFSACSFLGVKPQTNVDRAKCLSELAVYLTDYEAQLDRFTLADWIPTNIEAKNHPDVDADIFATIAYNQTENSVPQGQYPGGWWDYAGLIGAKAIKSGTIDPAQILKSYSDSLDAFLS